MGNKLFKIVIKNSTGDQVYENTIKFKTLLDAQNWAIKQIEIGFGKKLGAYEAFVSEVEPKEEPTAAQAAQV